VDLPGLSMKNPVMPASGCFSFGREYSEFYSLNKLGAVIMKAATGDERQGNPSPRGAETASGMLNAIGWENPGEEQIVEKEVPAVAQYAVPIIANVAGSTIEEYEKVATVLNKSANIAAIELNISCPNVKEGGIQFGTNPSMAKEVTRRVKAISRF